MRGDITMDCISHESDSWTYMQDSLHSSIFLLLLLSSYHSEMVKLVVIYLPKKCTTGMCDIQPQIASVHPSKIMVMASFCQYENMFE